MLAATARPGKFTPAFDRPNPNSLLFGEVTSRTRRHDPTFAAVRAGPFFGPFPTPSACVTAAAANHSLLDDGDDRRTLARRERLPPASAASATPALDPTISVMIWPIPRPNRDSGQANIVVGGHFISLSVNS
jgi:hypothetical protein